MAEIKNLKKAANRIKKAIRNNERIILYGDADLDGVASVIILKETLKNLDSEEIAIYFPDREIEGYGITKDGLNSLTKFAPALLIAFDLGIGNFREVKLARKLGLEVVIIDHHEVLDKLPEAEIIVDPKQKGDRYPFKGLATAGICFKLSEILLAERMTENFTRQNFARQNLGGLRKSFLELVALATIADMMPQDNDNKIFIEAGLSSLENSWRPGLKVFSRIVDETAAVSPPRRCARVNETKNYRNNKELSQKIISALNVTDFQKNHLNETYLLLTLSSFEEAEILAKNLIEKSYQRQEKIREITREAEERVLKKISDTIVFEGDELWPLTLSGAVASRICRLYKKPTFIFNKQNSESVGAVRTPSEINSVALMKKCKKYLINYGGHPQASGFRIKNENLEKFKQCLLRNTKSVRIYEKRE